MPSTLMTLQRCTRPSLMFCTRLASEMSSLTTLALLVSFPPVFDTCPKTNNAGMCVDFCSDKFRQGWEEDKDNIGTVDDLLDAYIKLYNDSISKLPADFHTGVHLCRGNFIGGRHFAEGAYDIIAQKLFTDLKVNTFYLEYDTERAGGFEPLKYLPKDRHVVIGAISTKLRDLEDKEEIKQRIYKAADFVAEGSRQTREEALKRIALSPQCGFSTHETGYPLSEEDEKKKLALVRQIADEVWGEA